MAFCHGKKCTSARTMTDDGLDVHFSGPALAAGFSKSDHWNRFFIAP